MDRSSTSQTRRDALRRMAALTAAATLPTLARAADDKPVLIGLDGEFGLDNSTSAQAVELGMRAAIAEINDAGGVLNGRPLELVIRDHRSMPARGIRNIREFAAMGDMVAVFGGRFSPVIIEELPTLLQTNMPFIAVWSSADAIVDNGMQPNYIFRVSLRDSLAMPRMLKSAEKRGLKRVGLLLTNTSWGRSSQAAADRYSSQPGGVKIVQTAWYNWRDTSLIAAYNRLRQAGADAIVLVANDDEAAILVKEMAALPAAQRLPIISHWGITGGNFVAQAGPALQQVDLTVIQTFSFFDADKRALQGFMRAAAMVSPIRHIEQIQSPVGVAHAYDATHLLARAIRIAGSAERAAVRDALENIPDHRGLVRRYHPAFTSTRHEALGPEQLLMARFRADGVLVPAREA
ncbi:ABC transporter substrate-binding protein [Noviherbaspirillum pedocola]|uniref:ABC transporter substrate-binding protein n=1 Tax=Noviherbaspirillum pedocola TaxID=2801341 RepID=A0A934W307_9BURK|nr:ABC transporter substrate-binding protein [Noviherbaspirillum pedocola]MBK4736916.1 ABC transporter substrate-binding protein [Noviherbaspirillum pedocola]